MSTKKLPRGIQKRKYEDGRTAFRVRFRVPTPDGGRKQASKEFDTLEAAQQFRDRTAKTLTRTGRLTLKEFVERYWNPRCEQRQKPSTRLADGSRLKTWILPRFGPLYLDAIAPATWIDFCNATEAADLSDRGKQNVFGLLHSILQYAVTMHMLAANPLAKATGSKENELRPRAERKEKPTLTPEQLRKVLKAVAEWRQPLVWTFALTGLRASEVSGLKWCDYDEAAKVLHIRRGVVRGVVGTPKTKNTVRQLYVPPFLEQMLERQRLISKVRLGRTPTPEDWIFCSTQGHPLNADTTRRQVLHPALKAAGIQPELYAHGWHLFRHSAGTGLQKQTGDVYGTSRFLGHASVKITESTYLHMSDAIRETEELARYWQAGVPEVCPIVVPQQTEIPQ